MFHFLASWVAASFTHLPRAKLQPRSYFFAAARPQVFSRLPSPCGTMAVRRSGVREGVLAPMEGGGGGANQLIHVHWIVVQRLGLAVSCCAASGLRRCCLSLYWSSPAAALVSSWWQQGASGSRRLRPRMVSLPRATAVWAGDCGWWMR